ncbi:MAG TPA: RNA polymerase sigma-70 factor [Thermopolyspora sp.]|jgi:RNA polymerase sigma factor, sigma-70 family/RNA polymerase sigma-70 factor, TIGR02957 family
MVTAEEFEGHRPMLLGLAYRLLGSMWDAEDVVQEAFLRWMRTERGEIREPRAFLVTVVTRLGLDQLRSARVAREAYTGPWLPEPADDSETLGPLDTVELRDTLSYATLHMMERLSPPERAVFVLREAFELPYDEVARIVGVSLANCRQLYHRAGKRMAEVRGRFRPSTEDHAKLVEHILDAARGGDLEGLAELLSEDVVAWTDGGGKVRAPLRPIAGRDKVLRFLAGVSDRYGAYAAWLVTVNLRAAIWLQSGNQRQLVMFRFRDGLVDEIYGIRNPDKLSRIRTRPWQTDEAIA